MRHYRFLLFGLACVAFTSCIKPLQPQEGFVEVTGGKIWYKVIGGGAGKPLMVMHGGPGGRSCGSIEPYQALAGDRPIIFFDQLESGMSDHPNDTTLWKPKYFALQVEALKQKLNLTDFHLLGSSWGGSVAIEYMATQNTDAIASVIFAAPLISTPQWMKDSKVLISKLSQPVQDTINKYEALQNYTAPAYLAATDTFYANFLARKKGVAPSTACDDVPKSNRAIYQYMWGPTEFNATGTLRTFDRISDLSNITKPTLFIGGEFDEVLTETLYYYQTLVTGSKVEIVPNAGHAKTRDNPEDYMRMLKTFLAEVESGK
jgi:proline iminopeptidase